jgi:membrane protein
MVLSAALSAVGAFFASSLPGGAGLWQVLNFILSFIVITLLFALILKVIPDVKLAWHTVWPGALFTGLLFSAGKYALGLYLGRASVASPYGAAGSVVVLVIWIYYAAQILFLGAEFTRAYARLLGADIKATRGAEPIPAARERHAETSDINPHEGMQTGT